MKLWTSEYTFKYPWEHVVEAAIRKYPNPMNPSVVGVDVIDRELVGNNLVSHKLMQTDFGIPSWITKLIGINGRGLVSEHSVVDPNGKKLSVWSRNLSLNHYMTVDEHLVYLPHPTEPGHTLLKQEAIVTVEGVPLASRMENAMVGSFQSNCQKGRVAIEWLIKELQTGPLDVVQQGAAASRPRTS